MPPKCVTCGKDFHDNAHLLKHLVACSKGERAKFPTWTLYDKGETEIRDHFSEEVDMIEQLYDNVVVERTEGRYPSLLFDLAAEANPRRRLLLRVSLVYGYPYIPPRLELRSPFQEDETLISKAEGKGLVDRLSETIQPLLGAGVPLIVQIVQTVQNELNNTPVSPTLKATGKQSSADAVTAGSAAASGIAAASRKESSAHSSAPPPTATGSTATGGGVSTTSAARGAEATGHTRATTVSPGAAASSSSRSALTKQMSITAELLERGAQEKERKRLTVLVLHLLSRLCAADRANVEDPVTTFEALKDYLCSDVSVLQPDVAANFCNGSVRSYYKTIIANALEQGPPLSWFWALATDKAVADSSAALAAAPSGQSRFKREFVQLKKLGEGGFAPVFMCRKKVDGRLYAVKRQLVKSEEAAKALREVQTLASLSHINIVKYFDAWLEEAESNEVDPNDDGDNEDTGAREEEELASSTSSSASSHDKRRKSKSKKGNNARSFFAGLDDSDDESEEDDDSDEDDEADGNDETTSSTSSKSTASTKAQRHRVDSRRSELGDVLGNSRYHVLYIQMELCHPRSLHDAIQQEDVVSNETILSTVLRQLLHVVEYVHQRNMIHRDIKPQNILFDSASRNFNGNIKVADFGLARHLSRVGPGGGLGHAGSFTDAADAAMDITEMTYDAAQVTGGCGTALYCAPEQYDGDSGAYGMTVDEFSVGMIAFELWLGAAGKNFRERFDEMVTARRTGVVPTWFSKWRPQVATIIQRLIAINPTERATAAEILKMAELPGEPAEIGQALDTCSKNMERMIDRILQRNRQHFLSTPLKVQRGVLEISEGFRAMQRLFAQVAGCFNAPHAYHINPFVPLTQDLDALQCDVLTDERGRCWCRTRRALPAVAFHVATSRRQGSGASASSAVRGVYHHLTGDPVAPLTSTFFATNCSAILGDSECAAFVLQLFSMLSVQEGALRLEFTHAGLFHLFPRDTQDQLRKMRFPGITSSAAGGLGVLGGGGGAATAGRAPGFSDEEGGMSRMMSGAGTMSGGTASDDFSSPHLGNGSPGTTPATSPNSRGMLSELLSLRTTVNPAPAAGGVAGSPSSGTSGSSPIQQQSASSPQMDSLEGLLGSIRDEFGRVWSSAMRDEFDEIVAQLMSWWHAVSYVVGVLRESCLPVPEFIFDPTLRPREFGLHRTLRSGIFAEFLCHRPPVSRLLATLSRAEGLLPSFALNDAHTLISCVEVDVRACADVASGGVITATFEEFVHCHGVGLMLPPRGVDESQVFEVLSQLRLSGVRADRITAADGWERHCKAAKTHQFWWTLAVTSDRLQLSRTIPKIDKRLDMPRVRLGSTVRDVMTRASREAAAASGASGGIAGGGAASERAASLKVQFLAKEDSSCVQLAKDFYSDMTHPLPTTIIAVPYTNREIRACINDFISVGGGVSGKDSSFGSAGGGGGSGGSGASKPGKQAPTLFEYLRHHSTKSLVPVFSTADMTLEFVVNNAMMQAKARRKEARRGGNGPGGGGGSGGASGGGKAAKLLAKQIAASAQHDD